MANYAATHDQRNITNRLELARLIKARVERVEQLVKGTVAEPLLTERDEYWAKMQTNTPADDRERLGEVYAAVDHQLEKMLRELPTFEFRWVAADMDTNVPVDVVPGTDADGAETSFRLLCPTALEEHDVANVGYTKYATDEKELTLNLFPRSGARFNGTATHYLGRSLALVWQGRVIDEFKSWMSTYEKVVLTRNLSTDEAQHLLEVLNQRSPPAAMPQAGDDYR